MAIDVTRAVQIKGEMQGYGDSAVPASATQLAKKNMSRDAAKTVAENRLAVARCLQGYRDTGQCRHSEEYTLIQTKVSTASTRYVVLINKALQAHFRVPGLSC